MQYLVQLLLLGMLLSAGVVSAGEIPAVPGTAVETPASFAQKESVGQKQRRSGKSKNAPKRAAENPLKQNTGGAAELPEGIPAEPEPVVLRGVRG